MVCGELEAEKARFVGCPLDLIVRTSGSISGGRLKGCATFLDGRSLFLSEIEVAGGRFSGRLTDCAIDQGRIQDANLQGANWVSVTAAGARIIACDMREMRNRGCSGQELEIIGCDLDNAAWRGGDFTGMRMSDSRINGMALESNVLAEVRLTEVDGLPRSFRDNEAEDAIELPEALARAVWGAPRRRQGRGHIPQEGEAGLR